jgi:hypothetical protein
MWLLILASSFQECARYMSPTQIGNFLDGAIRNRISVRLIAEQHIALSQALSNPDPNSTNVGVVNMECSPREMIKMCGSFVTELCEATLGASPEIVIDGHADATFAYVFPHLFCFSSEIFDAAQIRACTSRIYPNRDPQKLLPSNRRTPPKISRIFPLTLPPPSRDHLIPPSADFRSRPRINLLLYPCKGSGRRCLANEHGADLLICVYHRRAQGWCGRTG